MIQTVFTDCGVDQAGVYAVHPEDFLRRQGVPVIDLDHVPDNYSRYDKVQHDHEQLHDEFLEVAHIKIEKLVAVQAPVRAPGTFEMDFHSSSLTPCRGLGN